MVYKSKNLNRRVNILIRKFEGLFKDKENHRR